MSLTAHTITLAASINEGIPSADNFRVVSSAAPTADALTDGDLLIRATHFSADPYQRSSIRSDRPNAKKVGEALTGFISGVVVASQNAAWVAGDLFGASLPLTTIQVVTPAILSRTVFWKLTGFCTEDKLSLGVGVLGMPGATAWGGLLKILRPVASQVLLVTAASGAVGQLVGQIAGKVKGCRVIGTAGGPEKCAALKDKFGFAEAIDYKSLAAGTQSLVEAIRKAAPEGLDMVFENVGGAHFEAGFQCLRAGGRVAVCGGIDAYCKGSIVSCDDGAVLVADSC
jgi:NADPH-dependent curcumin reductase